MTVRRSYDEDNILRTRICFPGSFSMWMRAEKEGYREGEGVHLSVSKKEHERWLYFDGFNLRASIQENAVGSVALKGTLLNHQTKLQEYTQMRLATTTSCFQALSSYNFRHQHARTFGYHLWLLDVPHSAQEEFALQAGCSHRN